jgi:hypothetical protein
MPIPEKDMVFSHEADAARIIALWKEIHGGDPAPEVVAAGVLASMAPYLHAGGDVATTQQRELTLGPVEALDVTRPFLRRQYCFKCQGRTICITLPSVEMPPLQ